MRFVRLRYGGERPFVIDFHPRITVLAGLDRERSGWLTARLTQLLQGDLDGFTGTIELHGAERELSGDTLTGVNGAIPEPAIVAADLPGAMPVEPVPPPAPAAAAAVEEDGATAHPAAEVARLSAELAVAHRARDEAEAERARAEAAAAAARMEGGGDDAVLGEAAAVVAKAEAAHDAAERRAEAAAAIPEESTADVAAALRAWEVAHAELGPPDPDAIALADRIEQALVELEAMPAVERPSAAAFDAARLAADAAAARAAGERILADDEVAAIEEAHEAVEVAESRRGLGGRRRLDEARAEEAKALAALGFTTYTEYLLHRATSLGAKSSMRDDAAVEARDTRAALDALHDRDVAPDARADLEAELLVLRGRAEALLGGPRPDVISALRARRASAQGDDTERALREALAAAGVGAGDDAATAAAGWLASADERRAQRVSGAQDAQTAVEQAKAALAAAREAHDAAVKAQGEEAASAQARRAALAAEAAGAGAAADQTRQRVAAIDAAMRAAQAQVDAIAADAKSTAHATTPADPGAVIDLTGVERVPLEVYLLARVAGQRDVGTIGSVPLVIDDAFAGLPDAVQRGVRDVITRYSAIIQFVYLTNDDSVEAWARSAGADVANVQRFSPATAGS